MITWVLENKEWVFSGFGLSLIVAVAAIIKKCCHKVKPKREEKQAEKSDNNISGGNNNTQIGTIETIGTINVTNHLPADNHNGNNSNH